MLRASVIIGASVIVGASVIMELCLCLFSSRLHKEETRLRPSLSAFQFHHLLFNLTAIQISNAGGHNCKCVCVRTLQDQNVNTNSVKLNTFLEITCDPQK